MEQENVVNSVHRKLSIVSLMGLPASGKSTFADTIVKLFNESPNTCSVILRYDDFVPLQIQKQFVHTVSAAKILRKNFLVSVEYIASRVLTIHHSDVRNPSSNTLPLIDLVLSSESKASELIDNNIFIQRVQDLLIEYKDQIEHCDKCFLIIDDNNYYRSMRNELYGIAKTLQCSFCVLYLKASPSQCIERNLLRPPESQVTTQIIEDMNKKIEEPNPIENTCDIFCVQINSPVEVDVQQSVKSLLEYSLENPVVYVPPVDRSEDRRICNENEIHQADLVLRKWVNSQLTLTSFDSSNLKSASNRKIKAQQMSFIKSSVLQKLKNGEFKIFSNVGQDIEFRKEIISFTTNVTVPPLLQTVLNTGDNVSSNMENVESNLNDLQLSN